ncbi:MAG: catalase/peroxidase HPI, partial [Myxococcota bacterium]
MLAACTRGAPETALDQNAETRSAGAERPYTNQDWWPNRLDLRVLQANAPAGDPVDADFDYGAAFSALDLDEVRSDIEEVLTTSQDWWPADYGHYGGLMIRLAWHSAGTYRTFDGRGGSASGTIRFAPLNSWPDNANLDRARRLLLPIKMKYGRALSWADLMVFAGNVALESMGFETLGFGGGRVDVFEPTDINWGPETEWLADHRFEDGELQENLGASMMGLIYVNPEGPGGNPDPVAAAERIRLTFARMGMNDEETVALIAGGHTLGKAHGAARAQGNVGPAPEGAPIAEQGLGWRNSHGTGSGADTITSGLEGAWTSTPVRWSHQYFTNLFGHEWELTRSPAGAQQWQPAGDVEPNVPDAHDPNGRHLPMMLTTDLALRYDAAYERISRRFLENPNLFQEAFARAWFKLTHRDMGPPSRLLGALVPEPQVWQDPVPSVTDPLVNAEDIASLKEAIVASGVNGAHFVAAAWASASTYRHTDHRGGANGARIRLAPMNGWAANDPEHLSEVLQTLDRIATEFNGRSERQISMADLIVLAGATAIETAAESAGMQVQVPFEPGRSDATAAMTDEASFRVLEPRSDGFRNFVGRHDSEREYLEALVERADLLTLTAPEMTVLVGGLRALGVSHGGEARGVLTGTPGTLDNAFFVNLLDMATEW